MWEMILSGINSGLKLYADWIAADAKEKEELEAIARARKTAGDEAEARVRAESAALRVATDAARDAAVKP